MATQDRLVQYRKNTEEAMAIFQEKNSRYGSAFVIGGLLGVVMECLGICGRLIVLVVRDFQGGAGHAVDVRHCMLDLLNYANMGLMCVEDENWKGIDWEHVYGHNSDTPKS